VFRIKELHGSLVCPYRLSLFKPDSMFPVIDSIFIIGPIISHKYNGMLMYILYQFIFKNKLRFFSDIAGESEMA
jgi:hypothetical protein